jgi:hypothetical protein
MMKIVFFLTIVMVGLVSCDSGPDPVEFQTDFLGINIEPSPGIVGEEMTFTCIIEDSLDTRFKFIWNIPNIDSAIVTENNSLKIIAKSTGEFTGGVTVSNEIEDQEPVSGLFSFSIVNQMEK